jgi:hypothetical protein
MEAFGIETISITKYNRTFIILVKRSLNLRRQACFVFKRARSRGMADLFPLLANLVKVYEKLGRGVYPFSGHLNQSPNF